MGLESQVIQKKQHNIFMLALQYTYLPLPLADISGVCAGDGLGEGSPIWSCCRFFIVFSTICGSDCEEITSIIDI